MAEHIGKYKYFNFVSIKFVEHGPSVTGLKAKRTRLAIDNSPVIELCTEKFIGTSQMAPIDWSS